MALFSNMSAVMIPLLTLSSKIEAFTYQEAWPLINCITCINQIVSQRYLRNQPKALPEV
ncbi:22203_t:CDS:2 [Dentiscutata erythropus]|uniref:22203_t:CDS:1 n=1 Tax=Dentiscutata erythropus TaxID=1348616 RepID=A0A9N9BBY2_9GLOM|nr:22203_t:CDS:2 [Dentiscutata erythropus]